MKNRLKAIRFEKKLTQAELAKLAGISRISLCHIENEFSVPDGETIVKLVHALNLPAEDIFLDLRVMQA